MYKLLMANKKLPFQILYENSNMVSMIFVVSFDLRIQRINVTEGVGCARQVR